MMMLMIQIPFLEELIDEPDEGEEISDKNLFLMTCLSIARNDASLLEANWFPREEDDHHYRQNWNDSGQALTGSTHCGVTNRNTAMIMFGNTLPGNWSNSVTESTVTSVVNYKRVFLNTWDKCRPFIDC
jgi:hypothetical protein